jgi:hypothetical protein
LSLLIGSALVGVASIYGISQGFHSSPWWFALPVVAFALLGCELWRLVQRNERDEQLAQIVDLPDNGVDLGLIDLHRWADAGASDPRWRCDLEDDTGEKR